MTRRPVREEVAWFLKQIAKEPQVTLSRQSHTFMTQLVATGEPDVIVDGHVPNPVALNGQRRAHRSRDDQPDDHSPAADHRHHGARAPFLRRRAVAGLPLIQRGERIHGEKSWAAGRRAKTCYGRWSRWAICVRSTCWNGGGAKDRQLAALLNKMSVRTPALTTRGKP